MSNSFENSPNSPEYKPKQYINPVKEMVSPIPKPDFSIIDAMQSSFSYKQGSYKKKKSFIPESPMKSPNQKTFTPVKSNSKILNNITRKKLNFDVIDEKDNINQPNLDYDDSPDNRRKTSLQNPSANKQLQSLLNTEYVEASCK